MSEQRTRTNTDPGQTDDHPDLRRDGERKPGQQPLHSREQLPDDPSLAPESGDRKATGNATGEE
jgi:hypothetical protein